MKFDRCNFIDGFEFTCILEVVEYSGRFEAVFGPFDDPSLSVSVKETRMS